MSYIQSLKEWVKKYFIMFYDSFVASVWTYKINKKEVGIIINNAVAITARIFTSIKKNFQILNNKKAF